LHTVIVAVFITY